MATKTVTLPLPRRILGEKAGSSRGAGPQDFHVLDDVPVPVRDVPASEAPEVLRLGARSWHVHEGRLYAPLFQEVSGPEPSAVALTMRQMATGNLPTWFDNKPRAWEKVVDYRAAAGGRYGAHVEAAGLRMRSVDDDGMAARDAEASRLAASLILVEGRLMHPAPAPYLLVDARQGRRPGGGADVSAIPQAPYENRFVGVDELYGPVPGRATHVKAVPMGEATPWLAFEAWRAEEADAFAAALAANGFGGSGARAAQADARFEILDRASLEEACPPRGLADYARASCAAYMEALSPSLHLRSDETLETLMAVRGWTSAAVDGKASAETAMERFRTLCSIVDGEMPETPGTRPVRSMAATGQAILLRYDEFERPHAGLAPAHAGDIDELVGLAR